MIKQKSIIQKTISSLLTYSEIGEIVCVTSIGDSITITLPASSEGVWYSILNSGPGAVTIKFNNIILTTLENSEQTMLLANTTDNTWFLSKGLSSSAILKEDIESVLTGEITSHSHASSSMTIEKLSSSSVLTTANSILIMNAASGPLILTLPQASLANGKIFKIKKTDNLNTVTIDPYGSELIDGEASFVITGRNQAIDVVCDGTTWYVM